MKILLIGHQKTGNTWCRFVIFNYWNILHNEAKETLTYHELIKINEEIWDGSKDYPRVYFSHTPINGKTVLGYNKGKMLDIFKHVEKIIYVIRNPFDTMISYFHYMMNRDVPFNGLFKLKEVNTLKGFVKKFLPLYINHVNSTMPLADLVIRYEDCRKNPLEHVNALKLIYGEVDLDVAVRAIEMSSFDKIKQMGIKTGRTGGLAASFRDHFTRDGRVGQYEEVMSPKLITYIKNECEKEGVET